MCVGAVLAALRQEDVTRYSSTTSPGSASLPRFIGVDPKRRQSPYKREADRRLHSRDFGGTGTTGKHKEDPTPDNLLRSATAFLGCLVPICRQNQIWRSFVVPTGVASTQNGVKR